MFGDSNYSVWPYQMLGDRTKCSVIVPDVFGVTEPDARWPYQTFGDRTKRFSSRDSPGQYTGLSIFMERPDPEGVGGVRGQVSWLSSGVWLINLHQTEDLTGGGATGSVRVMDEHGPKLMDEIRRWHDAMTYRPSAATEHMQTPNSCMLKLSSPSVLISCNPDQL